MSNESQVEVVLLNLLEYAGCTVEALTHRTGKEWTETH